MLPLAGPRILLLVAVLEALMVGAVLASPHAGEPDLRAAVRLTAAVSVFCFLLAFTASPLARRWPGPGTRWLVANRRWLGLSFATSHAMHAVVLWRLTVSVPGFAESVPLATKIAGALGFLVIALMAATSNDASVRALGPRRWTMLHTVGIHYLWIVFAATYGPTAIHSPFHAVVTLVLLAALALRWTARPGHVPATAASALRSS
jgi:sulfoxide reductase heme-binding subunit YedZ